jgi:hypothetical protein
MQIACDPETGPKETRGEALGELSAIRRLGHCRIGGWARGRIGGGDCAGIIHDDHGGKCCTD